MSSGADTLERQDVIQRDKLEKWSQVNLIKLNKGKIKVLHLGGGNPWYQHRLEHDVIESSPVHDLRDWWM